MAALGRLTELIKQSRLPINPARQTGSCFFSNRQQCLFRFRQNPLCWGQNKRGQIVSQEIDYGNLMHTAMRGLIRSVLEGVAEHGLPGNHHFFITFDTRHPDAKLADWLRERYPQEMTVVMQHWFDNLTIDPDGFAVTLNFGDSPEPLYIPFDAIQTFVDPSVEFGLRFETADDDDDESSSDAPQEQDNESKGEKMDGKSDAEVVSLDSFRK